MHDVSLSKQAAPSLKFLHEHTHLWFYGFVVDVVAIGKDISNIFWDGLPDVEALGEQSSDNGDHVDWYRKCFKSNDNLSLKKVNNL